MEVLLVFCIQYLHDKLILDNFGTFHAVIDLIDYNFYIHNYTYIQHNYITYTLPDFKEGLKILEAQERYVATVTPLTCMKYHTGQVFQWYRSVDNALPEWANRASLMLLYTSSMFFWCWAVSFAFLRLLSVLCLCSSANYVLCFRNCRAFVNRYKPGFHSN